MTFFCCLMSKGNFIRDIDVARKTRAETFLAGHSNLSANALSPLSLTHFACLSSKVCSLHLLSLTHVACLSSKYQFSNSTKLHKFWILSKFHQWK